MSDTEPKVETTKAKARRTTRARKPQFKAISPAPGQRDMASPETQKLLHDLFTSMTAQERAGAIKLFTVMSTNPALLDGYKKQFRFLREYIPSLTAIKF